MCECDPEKLLDVDEAASLLNAKAGTLYSWVSKRKIPFRKVGSLVRFDRAELMAWTIEQARGVSQNQSSERKKLQSSKLRMVQ
jgi:excisionase family DNA binding protein